MNPTLQNGYSNLRKLGNITTPYGGSTTNEPFHPAVDVANAKGTPIPSFTPGTVVEATSGHVNGDYGFGNIVKIKDKQGVIHQYAHLNQPLVKPGQVVGKNQVIAKMGDSGNSYSKTGGDSSHLDYRASANGKYINPLHYTNGLNIQNHNSGGMGGMGGKGGGVGKNDLSSKFCAIYNKYSNG